jgi:hypothetical protein
MPKLIDGIAKTFPFLAPEIHVVPTVALLDRGIRGKNDRIQRADLNTGFFAIKTSRFVPVGSFYTEIAFLRTSFLKIPDSPAGRIGTGIYTVHAPYTFLGVHGKNVIVVRIPLQCIHRTNGNTRRFHTLSALGNDQIVGKTFMGIL